MKLLCLFFTATIGVVHEKFNKYQEGLLSFGNLYANCLIRFHSFNYMIKYVRMIFKLD